MPFPAADLARRLASEAEAVCRHYLSNGRRAGRYWLVGPWAIFSDTAFAWDIQPGASATRLRPARASKPCSRSVVSWRPCGWRRRSRLRISPPSDSLRRCAVSTSSAMAIRPAEIATARLADRARDAGIEVLVLSSRLGDFNDDLRRFGIDRLWADLRTQLAPGDFGSASV